MNAVLKVTKLALQSNVNSVEDYCQVKVVDSKHVFKIPKIRKEKLPNLETGHNQH